MKTISNLLLLVSSLALGCASTQGAVQRGDLIVHGPSVKAVVVGPTAIRAYSGFAGGSVYTAPAISGTDGDCQTAAAQATARQILQAAEALGTTVTGVKLARTANSERCDPTCWRPTRPRARTDAPRGSRWSQRDGRHTVDATDDPADGGRPRRRARTDPADPGPVRRQPESGRQSAGHGSQHPGAEAQQLPDSAPAEIAGAEIAGGSTDAGRGAQGGAVSGSRRGERPTWSARRSAPRTGW
jgi:hypothetical protein